MRCCVTIVVAIAMVWTGACELAWSAEAAVSGELKVWHRVTLTLEGPQTSEQDSVNPFLQSSLEVVFQQGDKQIHVRGFYAADGHAAETGASEGNVWQAYFTPDTEGRWTYVGTLVVNSDTGEAPAQPTASFRGTFEIQPSDKTGVDNRRRGMLRYVGKRYLQYAGTKEYYLKGGADSPENFLAYEDFDGTFDTADLRRPGEAVGDKFLHAYAPHVQDYHAGDPTWQKGKGKAIIGALNYLAAQGMNSVYFLTYNIDGGDGKDVWPWTGPTERFRFDCSKLAQWEIVFSHMDRLGITLHVILQEQENDQGLDQGELGPQRTLYLQELIARFAHHPALVWNLGEENTNTDEQRKTMSAFIRRHDPYDHPIVCHTFPDQYERVYRPLLGYPDFEGPSLQTLDTHAQTIKWIDASAAAGRPWFVCLDEVAQANVGVMPDQNDFWHDEIRAQHLWGNLMAGGAGVEWYFGYQYANNDLNCEDWRSRHHMWALTRYALTFFQEYLPFVAMQHHDEMTRAEDDYCLAQPGQVYAVYLPTGGTTQLNLGEYRGPFTVLWYNPRTGGHLQEGSCASVTGPGWVSMGNPPTDQGKDWVALIRLARPD